MYLLVSSYVSKKVQDFVKWLHEVHNAIRDNLVRANTKYKQDADQKRRHVDFEVGDFVLVVLTKDHFTVGEYNNLLSMKIAPVEIVEKVNSNAYRLKLSSHDKCFDVFNVKYLFLYHGNCSNDDPVAHSKTNFFYLRGNNVLRVFGHVSPMKSKVTGNSDSPRSRRDSVIASVVSDKLTDLVKDIDIAPVVSDKLTDLENASAGNVVKDTTPIKDKVHYDVVKDKASGVVKHKAPTVGKKKPAGNVVKDTTLIKDRVHFDFGKDKAPDVVKHKAPAIGKKKPAGNVIKDTTPVKDKKKPTGDVVKDTAQVDVHSDVVSDKVYDDVVKDKVPDVVKEKHKTELSKDKPKGKVPSVGQSKVPTELSKEKAKDKPYVGKGKVQNELPKDKNKADLPKDKPKSKDKHNVDSELLVLRSKSKCKPEVKAKAFVRDLRSNENVKHILSKEDHSKKKLELKMVKGTMDIDDSNSDLDSDEVDFDSSFDEVSGQKPKKLKIKAELKRKRKDGLDSNSSSIDEEKVRRLLKRLKKIKKEILDEESDMKSKKKGFSAFYNVAIEKIPSRLGRYVVANFNSTTYRLSLDTGNYVEVTPSKIHDILGDIASKLIFAQEVDFLFKVNFLTLFTNTMGRVVSLRGKICLDVVRRLREDCVISKIDWCGYIHSFLKDSKLPKKRTVQYLGLFTFPILLYLDSIKFDMFLVVRTRPSIRDWTSTLTRQRQDLETKEHVIGCLELHDEWNESELQETEGFTRVSSLEIFEREALFKKAKEKLAIICFERVFLEDLMRKASSVYSGYGNVDEDLNDKEPLGSNLSFGFSKVSLDDFNKQPSGSGKSPKNQVVEKESVDPSVQEYEILSTPDSYTQWLERNADSVEELTNSITYEYLYCDLFGQNLVIMEVLNQGPFTPDRMPTRASKVSPSSEKRVVKPSFYLLSSYMNKKKKVPKFTRMEFIVGNSLFAMQGDKMGFVVYGIRLNMETLATSLWIDANIIDCWGSILNHEERFRDAESKARHFSLLVIFLTTTTSMTILDNSRTTYDSKYKEFCGFLKKMCAHHLKLYGHNKHAQVARLKHKIPKLKWSTKGNFHDCGIFSMLYMKSYNGGTAPNWHCRLLVKSQLQCDMLRRLQFKFATNILLHEVNVHAKKMLDLATEFDKVDRYQMMSIIVETVKKSEERDRI
nr:hypothetical protein [Tanacetum cinerariifolium]